MGEKNTIFAYKDITEFEIGKSVLSDLELNYTQTCF